MLSGNSQSQREVSMTLKFEPKEFEGSFPEHLHPRECAHIAQEKYDKWLSEQKKVYSGKHLAMWGIRCSETSATQAFLVDIKPIKECEHEVETLETFGEPHDPVYGSKCIHCRQKVQPTRWELRDQ